MSGRPAVVGVGNRLRGDDAVGCRVVDELAGSDAVLIDAGSAPENFIQPILDSHPDRVLFIDACDFGGKPGEFRLFDRQQLDALSYGLVSTHTLPLTLTVEMLVQGTGARISLLGVQPQQIQFGEELSAAVDQSVPAIVQFVRSWLSG